MGGVVGVLPIAKDMHEKVNIIIHVFSPIHYSLSLIQSVN